MLQVVSQAALIILLGTLWKQFRPAGLDAISTRKVLTTFVYYLLLPALVLEVMWHAPLGIGTVQVAGMAWVGLLTSTALCFVAYHFLKVDDATKGAMFLAAIFPNATYLGLPVLEASLGSWARSVALQYDLFACTPFLFTVGILLAQRYGSSDHKIHPLRSLSRVPPLWAALLGVALNLGGVPSPVWVNTLLNTLSVGVIPLMLFSIGLGLVWRQQWLRNLTVILPAALVQLLICPLIVWASAGALELPAELSTAVVLEAAMPSMVLGIVLCDQFRLNTETYATCVTATTTASLVTLPLWHSILVN
jgi:predicted permease